MTALSWKWLHHHYRHDLQCDIDCEHDGHGQLHCACDATYNLCTHCCVDESQKRRELLPCRPRITMVRVMVRQALRASIIPGQQSL